MLRTLLVLTLALFGAIITTAPAAEPTFAERVGDVTVAPVAAGQRMKVPFITWGGDMITFHANGGLRTRPGSIMANHNLDLELTAGDDFTQQVRDYLAGKTPFLRGTMRMMGMASEVIGRDPRTRGVVIMQLTWSAGDHLVGNNIASVSDLRGKRIALQYGGPHVGMLDDILSSAQLGWSDITPVWCADLTASDDSPAAAMRAGRADAACVITPDMIGITGGLRETGSGAEGTIGGAKVVVSTADMSRSIADVYVVRQDFYDANKPFVKNFINAYLQAAEAVVPMRNAFEGGDRSNGDYRSLLQLTREIYGDEVIVDLEADAHGLLLDCSPVGWPGNHAFFNDAGNTNGVAPLGQRAVSLAERLGIARAAEPLVVADLDWRDPLIVAGLQNTSTERGERFRAEAVLEEIEALDDELDDRTILSFSISFEPNQVEFDAIRYAEEYQRVVELGQRYGNAVVAIRGHADPSKTLADMVRAGMAKGVLTRSGGRGNRRYFLDGRPFDITNTAALVAEIRRGTFGGVPDHDPLQTMTAALNLSRQRSEAVRASIMGFARERGLTIDQSQIQPLGVGVSEPLVPRPRSMDEARENMRVEFRLVRVEAEAMSESDFDF